MSKAKIVSIGGIEYDSQTGLPIKTEKTIAKPVSQSNVSAAVKRTRTTQAVHAKGVHATQQRSKTLKRSLVSKAPTAKASSKSVARPIVRKNMDIRPKVKTPQSAHISKFASDPKAFSVKRPAVSDIAPKQHPAAQKVQKSVATVKQTQVQKNAPTAKQIKHAELGKALAHAKPAAPLKKTKRPQRRLLNVVSASFGLLLLAGYFTYVNMPNLSVRVAAAQAGIDASYPEYHPVGYRLNGPVAYRNGEVSMNFASNTGPLAFSLSQSKSGWDSSALLEKYVNPRSDSKYATYSDAGLTVYTYGTNAAWVNRGILYTIDGNANLSNEQIRRIATSM